MTAKGIRPLIRRLVDRLSRHESGLAAVEFSLILPILVVLWIGGVEVTQALSVDRRLNNLAAAMGDLVSRCKIVTEANMANIFRIAPGAMFPHCKWPHTMAKCLSEGLSMRVTAVKMDDVGNATVAWSRAHGPTGFLKYNTNDDMNSFVPEDLRVPETQIIMSEVEYSYTPAVGYVITGGAINLNDTMYFVPRLVSEVRLCESNPPATNCES